MSTKNLRKALHHLEDARGKAHPVYIAALAEVEAIERAAKVLDDDEVRRALRHAPSEVHDAMTLLESIAKEAK